MTAESGIRLEALLYRRLLDLSGPEAIAPVLRSILELLARLTGAELAYLEAEGPEARIELGHAATPRAREDSGAQIASEILRRAVARREVIATGCACHDARFRDHESVKRHRVRAVLCVPLESIPGALYLQGFERFSPDARQHAELCARHVGEQLARRAPDADRLTLHRATRLFQRRHLLAALERTSWNIAETARELEVARSYLYRLLAALELKRPED